MNEIILDDKELRIVADSLWFAIDGIEELQKKKVFPNARRNAYYFRVCSKGPIRRN